MEKERKKIDLVFMYGTKTDFYYLEEGRKIVLGKKLGNGSSGAIFEAETDGEGRYFFSIKQNPKAFFKDVEKVAEWRAKDLVLKAGEKFKTQSQRDYLKESLKPLKKAYINEDAKGKAVLIHWIIDFLNT